MYAIVKKVVMPARSSVVNLALRISFGLDSQHRSFTKTRQRNLTYMTRAIEMKVSPNDGCRDAVIDGSFFSLNETHCRGYKIE